RDELLCGSGLSNNHRHADPELRRWNQPDDGVLGFWQLYSEHQLFTVRLDVLCEQWDGEWAIHRQWKHCSVNDDRLGGNYLRRQHPLYTQPWSKELLCRTNRRESGTHSD